MKVKTATPLARGEGVNYYYGRIGGVPGQDFIRKSDLIDGEYYFGHCRNAKCAKWVAAQNEFVYVRTKFGSSFDETIRHPEDDDGYDLFVPIFRCYPEKSELVTGDEAE